jgi:2-polyprenyl-3-methyl-5-hydroxy-6-metoxy-1,4-benzoquinol methylase
MADDYSQKGHYYIEQPRKEVLALSSLLDPPASVLDIGAGYGNNTYWLLSRGHAVTAIETNHEAVLELQKFKKNFPKNVIVFESSVDAYMPQQTYDAVVCCMVLHFLKDVDVGYDVIKAIQSWTSPGGLNVITTYTSENSLSDDYTFLLRPNELRKLYEGWEIVQYEESYARNFRSAKNFKDIARLVARKRGYKSARLIARKSSDAQVV